MEKKKDEIEQEVGESLVWHQRPAGRFNMVVITKAGVKPADESDWTSQMEWLSDMLERFDKTFRQRVKELDVEKFEEDEQ